MRINTFLIALLVAVGVVRNNSACAADQADRPNVIVFLTDDQGWADLSCHGNPRMKTPYVDRFARESVEFERFYVSPVCSPTRASLLTGRWNFRTGVFNVTSSTCQMNRDEVTLADLLAKAGYATAMYGKWHLGEDESLAPHRRGFQDAIYPQRGQFGKYNNPTALHNGKKVDFKGYSLDLWIDHAIAFMKKAKAQGRPFFLYLPTNLVHSPMDPKPGYDKPFLAKGLKKPVSAIYGMQQSIDENFGRLMKALADEELEQNTLSIYFSDNGPQGYYSEGRYMGGLRGVKGIVYENGIRVPCFVRWPKGNLKAGRKITNIAAHVDIMPTILKACQVEIPKALTLDGKSLLPLLEDAQAASSWPDRNLFFQWDAWTAPRKNLCFAVIGQKYKLVQARGNQRKRMCDQYEDACRWNDRSFESIKGTTPKYELFDIEKDPGEDHDLSARFPEKVKELRTAYESWYDEVTEGFQQRKQQNNEAPPSQKLPAEETAR